MRSWRVFPVALVLLLLAGPLSARDRLHRIHEFAREGFLIGFSLGFGSVYPCDECPGFGGEFHVGAMAQPDLAIFFDVSAVGSQRNRRDQGLGLVTIGVQYWPHLKFWVKGGVGIGETLDEGDFNFDGNSTSGDRSWGAMAGAGYEIVQKGRFAFDVQVRAGVAGDRQSVALNLGFNWY